MNDAMMQTILDDLKSHDVDVEKLCVVTCATEQYIGELVEFYDNDASPVRVKLKNPRRILRLQKVTPGNISIEVVILDIDLVLAGTLTFWPVVFYKLSDVSEVSRAAMLAMYARYFKARQVASAAQAGIVIPQLQTQDIPK